MPARLATALRVVIGLVGVFNLYVAFAFYVQLRWVNDFWPWSTGYDGMSPMSFYFISSIAAAIGAPLLWIAATGSLRASAAGAVNLTIAFGGIGVYMLSGAADASANPRLMPAAMLMLFFALANLAVVMLVCRMPVASQQVLPRLVRWSFATFALTLLIVGIALIRVVPAILPWDITPEGSITYGWIFLGAATYFAYGVARPRWGNAIGPLLGFLAYDLILIVPFVQHFSTVQPHLRNSLIIYTTAVAYSGLLAIYFLFFHTETRLFRSMAVGIGR